MYKKIKKMSIWRFWKGFGHIVTDCYACSWLTARREYFSDSLISLETHLSLQKYLVKTHEKIKTVDLAIGKGFGPIVTAIHVVGCKKRIFLSGDTSIYRSRF